MKKGLNKFTKGMFAIFIIKLLLFGGAFVIQSCQNDENIFVESEQKLVLKNFENLAKQTIPEANLIIENFKITRNNLKVAKSTIVSKASSNNKSFTNIEEIEALTEIEVESILHPLIISAKELLNTYDVTENDLRDIFEELGIFDTNDPSLILIALEIAKVNNSNDNSFSSINSNDNSLSSINLVAQSLYAQNTPRDCFLETTGISAGIALVGALTGQTISKTVLLKLIKKVAKKIGGRVLGGIGIALMVYDYGRCMDYWVSGGSNPLNISDCNNLVKVKTKHWNYNEPYVYISKKAINYISDSNYQLSESTGYYDIYEISANTTSTDCSVTNTNRKISGKNIVYDSIEGYTPHEIDTMDGDRGGLEELLFDF